MNFQLKFYQSLMPEFSQRQIKDWMTYNKALDQLANCRNNFEKVDETFIKFSPEIIKEKLSVFKSKAEETISKIKNGLDETEKEMKIFELLEKEEVDE